MAIVLTLCQFQVKGRETTRDKVIKRKQKDKLVKNKTWKIINKNKLNILNLNIIIDYERG